MTWFSFCTAYRLSGLLYFWAPTFVALQIKGDTRKLVYHALVGLLQDNDIAVRVCSTSAIPWHYECIAVPTCFNCLFIMFNFQLAACSSLCYLFQESCFSELDLFERLPTCWTMSFKLIEDVQEFDSKVCISKAQFLFSTKFFLT